MKYGSYQNEPEGRNRERRLGLSYWRGTLNYGSYVLGYIGALLGTCSSSEALGFLALVAIKVHYVCVPSLSNMNIGTHT